MTLLFGHRTLRTLKLHRIHLAACLLALLATGCSSQKNTAGSRFWQAFTTRFNVYFNGSEAYKEGMKALEDGNKDNYQETIPLYPIGNKKSVGTGGSQFDRAIEKSQKAIKLHSIRKKPPHKPEKRKDPKYQRWMAKQEYNPFLHHAWMLMGKAQFQKGEFLEAASTFSYITRLYATEPAIVADARIWMARCYTEMDWFYDAEDALEKINNDSLPQALTPAHASAYANYLLRQKRFKEAVPFMLTTIKHEKSKKQKAREYYLLGQIYQATGQPALAYKAYDKAIGQNPPYELELNARIKQTEVIPLEKGEQTIKRLRRMARNGKNADYQDQIYYAIGNICLARNDSAEAIAQYRKGVEKSTRGGLEKGILLLRLGDIYWVQAEYVEAQQCYADALGLIDKEHAAYEQTSKRSEVLDELVTHVVNVELQDSLQHLASLPEAERLKVVERIIEQVKKQEEEERKAAELEKLMSQREEAMADMPQRNDNAPKPTNTGDKSWYFYNAQLVSQGKSEFQRKWGRRKLEDHWRRRNKTVLADETFAPIDYEAEEQRADSLAAAGLELATDSLAAADTLVTDNKDPKFYLQQIPLTEEAMAESNAILSDGLFNMGLIYKDKLEDFGLAQQTFQRLYTQFPDFERMDEVFYNLYLMNARRGQEALAESYKDSLAARFAESKYTLTLADPDFRRNAVYGKHLEDSLYADTYLAYSQNDYERVRTNCETSGRQYAMGQHRPKFLFLHAMSQLQSGDHKGFMETLKGIVSQYPQHEISEIAGNIVKGLQDGRLLAQDGSAFGSIWERRKTDAALGELPADSIVPPFSSERNTSYWFVLAYEEGKVNENLLLYEMARYNFSNFILKNFDLVFAQDRGIAMLQVREFADLDEALQYKHRLYADADMARKLGGMRALVISASNFELLQKYYSFDDYAEFFESHYGELPEPALPTDTDLDAPLLFEGVDQVDEEDY